MPRWAPDSTKIGKAELLGRRLFPRPSLVGATDQRPVPSFDIRNFEDSSGGKEISLDRLGRSNSENQVLRYLSPRAEAAAKTLVPKKIFNGWACIQAKVLQENRKLPLDVVPSPMPGNAPELGDDDLSANLYHAHACSQRDCDAYFVALHLQSQFEKYGRIEYSPNDRQRPSWISSLLLRISSAFGELSKRF